MPAGKGETTALAELEAVPLGRVVGRRHHDTARDAIPSRGERHHVGRAQSDVPHVDPRSARLSEQQRFAVGMLVRVALVKPAGEFFLPDTRDFPDLGRIRQAGHVPDHCAQVHIRAALLKLERVGEIVSPMALEIHRIERAGATMQFSVLNPPRPDDPRFRRVLDTDDVDTGRDQAMAGVGIWTRQFLLDRDV